METRLYYYKGKKECDFVVAEGGKVDILIQVSWDISDKDTLKREIAGLLEASEKLSCSNLWLITTDAEDTLQVNDRTIHILPAWVIMLKPLIRSLI